MNHFFNKFDMRLRIIAILLVCIIFALCILDSPEYIHCIHLDLPVSFDLHKIVMNILKVDFVCKSYYVTWDNFFSILENSIDNKESFLPFILVADHLLSVIIDCRNNDLESPAQPFPVFIEDNLIPKTLKLTGISIIRS